MLCWYKDAMKKIECRGGKTTVLWGVSDNTPNLLVPQLAEEYFKYYGVSVRNF